MRLRRCATLWLEPRETAHFDLANLLNGDTGVVGRLCWFAHAPHLSAPVEVDATQVPLLGALGAVDWIDRASLDARFGSETVDATLASGLLLAEHAQAGNAPDEKHSADPDGSAAVADSAFRAAGWHAPAAVAHMASRWDGIDALKGMAEQDVDTNEGLLRRHGAPPSHLRPPRDGDPDIALPRIAADAFDDLLDTRTTCRNFETRARVPLATFSQLMARVFGARGVGHPAPGFDVLKRTSPSGGALHPTECWLIVQRVQDVAPGLYRYRIDTHALEPIAPGIAPPQPGDSAARPLDDSAPRAWSAAELRAFARIAVAGQDWFADAPVLCILAPRFHRNFWKYRNHAKAYRVAVLDVGHLSQTLQLCATQAGLGPFITSAINEVDIELAFGLVPYADGPLAVCGFGTRGDTLTTSEFDPNRKVWPGK